jgi:hypothetical protein
MGHAKVAARHVLTILAVEDLGRSVDFYRRAFDWEPAVTAPVYVELALPGGMRLGLYERTAFARTTGQVPERVPVGGLAPTELYLHEAAYVADPDGNVVVVARPV